MEKMKPIRILVERAFVTRVMRVIRLNGTPKPQTEAQLFLCGLRKQGLYGAQTPLVSKSATFSKELTLRRLKDAITIKF
jgi:hypothetical protein